MEQLGAHAAFSDTQLLAPTWWLTAVCNFIPGDSGLSTYMQAEYSYTQNSWK